MCEAAKVEKNFELCEPSELKISLNFSFLSTRPRLVVCCLLFSEMEILLSLFVQSKKKKKFLKSFYSNGFEDQVQQRFTL